MAISRRWTAFLGWLVIASLLFKWPIFPCLCPIHTRTIDQCFCSNFLVMMIQDVELIYVFNLWNRSPALCQLRNQQNTLKKHPVLRQMWEGCVKRCKAIQFQCHCALWRYIMSCTVGPNIIWKCSKSHNVNASTVLTKCFVVKNCLNYLPTKMWTYLPSCHCHRSSGACVCASSRTFSSFSSSPLSLQLACVVTCSVSWSRNRGIVIFTEYTRNTYTNKRRRKH